VEQAGTDITSPNINTFTAETLIRLLADQGTGWIVLSPGSRSTPLAVAAAGSGIPLRVVTDERAAAYYATGLIRASGKPAAVITTSGTAVANCFPAVVEAFQSRLPLFVLSADRPGELQDCGANQTIDQREIFGGFAREFVQVPSTIGTGNILPVLQRCRRALDRAIFSGEPAHINCRFREPLAPVPGPFDRDGLGPLADRFFDRADADHHAGDPGGTAGADAADAEISKARRGLIVAGPQNTGAASGRILDLAAAAGWPVAADVLSQLRLRLRSPECVCGSYDLFLDGETGLAPDVVVHVGGLPTSARLQRYLSAHRGVDYVRIQDHNRRIDPEGLETARITGDIDAAVGRLIDRFGRAGDPGWLASFTDRESTCRRYLRKRFDNGRLGEPAIAHLVGRCLTGDDSLFLSNSMPVRDADSFVEAGTADVPVGANRGASGIDGIIASACGFGAGAGRRTTLLIGDLAFLHDIGSLALVARSDVPVVVVVVNNNGGGIFSFLPIADFPEVFEPYFGTPHGREFRAAAELFDLPYHRPADAGEFRAVYRDVLNRNRSAVIEIGISRQDNVREHETLRAEWKNEFLDPGEPDVGR
jgi:2-succinyl-5-enolpyruvyl-6-hydroxy-3-cyclohexene-1-carboxylate synthase